MGLDEWLVKVSWLGNLASVFWWVVLDLFSWSAMKYLVVSFDVYSVYGFGVTFGHLYFNAQGYVPALLEN